VWANSGYNTLGRTQSNNFTNTYELQGNMTKVLGAHTIKVGADIRQINYLLQNSGEILRFTGDTTWTQRSNVNGTNTEGDGYASFLMGVGKRRVQLPPVSVVETAVRRHLRPR